MSRSRRVLAWPLVVSAALALHGALVMWAPLPERVGLSSFSIIPVGLGAAAWGIPGGLLVAAAAVGLNWLAFGDAAFTYAGLVGHAMLLPVVVGPAWVRRMMGRMSEQARVLAALRDAEARRAEHRDALARLAPTLLAARDEDALLAALGRDLRRLVTCERSVAVYFLVRSPDDGEPLGLAPVYADGAIAAAVRANGVRHLRGAIGEVVRTAKPYIWRPDGDTIAEPVTGAPDRPGAMMAIPLLGREGPIGSVTLTTYRQTPYTAEEAEVALLFCNQAALAIENLRLFQSAAEARAQHRLDQLKDELMRTLSHELRTPLSYIFGYSELLAASQLSGREHKMAVETHHAADYMRRLLDNFQELDEIEHGVAQIQPQPLDLAACVARAIALVQTTSDNRHAYVVEIPDHLPAALADPRRVEQVLVHLLTNATWYSPPDTEVGVSAVLQEPPAGARGGDRASTIEVWVADHGAGLTEEQRDRAFEKLYRGSLDLTAAHPGAGLGLAICRGLVELHGGRIWAESAGPGQGATFRFTLPVAPVPLAADRGEHGSQPLRTNESAAPMAASAVLKEPRLR